MSDYEYTDSENTDNEDEKQIIVVKKKKPNKKINKYKTLIKYTSDGLPSQKYEKSDVKNDKLVRAECCYNYYKSDAYTHQTKYNLEITGMIVCIHCYFSFNIHKFPECTDLSKNEEECLKFYIDNFTKDHDTVTCQRIKTYNKCILCESKVGIVPKIIDKNEENIYEKLPCDTYNLYDTVIVAKKPASDFVLVL